MSPMSLDKLTEKMLVPSLWGLVVLPMSPGSIRNPKGMMVLMVMVMVGMVEKLLPLVPARPS